MPAKGSINKIQETKNKNLQYFAGCVKGTNIY